MTVLEKQGPSTGPSYEESSTGDYPAEKVDHLGAPEALPPSYIDSVAGTSRIIHTPGPGLPPASNYVALHQRNSKISGTWTIDTNLQVPESLLKPLESGQTERPHLSLHTWNGSVTAAVALVSGTVQRATVDIYTSNGKVSFNMVCTLQPIGLIISLTSYNDQLSRVNTQPLNLKIVTRNGAVHVSLPRDFCGPLKYNTHNGKVKFSNELMKTLRVFTDATAFVGDWQLVGFKDHKTWEGDDVNIQTSNGSIWIGYEGDPEGKGLPQSCGVHPDSRQKDRGSRQDTSKPGEREGEPSGSQPSKLKKGGGWWGRRRTDDS
ncbi:hypothetical protein FRC18_009245 [Serendipita sp. 400]|nr:hypothetical protein FRC18_009245 [Serendipita sp. 400]